MIDYLIVGLGNPGSRYNQTRHNVGFELIDCLLGIVDKAKAFEEDKRKQTAIVRVRCQDQEIVLAKPLTYMNLSGEAVVKLIGQYRIKPNKLIVIGDDYNLELGMVRIRFGGASGGHHGLESIMAKIGPEFWRLRIGIGSPEDKPAEAYVLEKFTGSEKENIKKIIDKSARSLLSLIIRDKLENKTIKI